MGKARVRRVVLCVSFTMCACNKSVDQAIFLKLLLSLPSLASAALDMFEMEKLLATLDRRELYGDALLLLLKPHDTLFSWVTDRSSIGVR